MDLSLPYSAPLRHVRRMSGQSENEAELKLLGAALKALRKEQGLTQEQAGEKIRPALTKQSWALHEQGKITGLLTPDVQRRVTAAIGCSPEDLMLAKEKLASARGSRPTSQPNLGLQDRSRAFDGAPGRRTATFPTSAGDVVLSYPELTPAALDEMEEWVTLFLKTSRARLAN